MIEFRYEKSGNAYLPMFKQPNISEDWKYFTKSSLQNESGSENSLIFKLIKGLAELCANTKTKYGSFGTIRPPQFLVKYKGQEVIFFEEEYLVCAFLGGAKSFFTKEVKEFTL